MVGDTWPERLADGATTGRPNAGQDFLRHRVTRHAHGDAVEAGGGQFGHRASGGLGQHERQRPGPERFGEAGRVARRIAPARSAAVAIGDVGDQRIEGGPALGGIKPGDRLAIGGIGAEPVDGLGRKRDEPARREAAR